MATRLNDKGYDKARALVLEDQVVRDGRDDWSEHQPDTAAENRFIDEHGWQAYGEWHLGSDDEHGPETKAHWKYPYGDFRKVHRCALLSAESRAGRNDHDDIREKAHELHRLLEQD
jgi:hypothetical protein